MNIYSVKVYMCDSLKKRDQYVVYCYHTLSLDKALYKIRQVREQFKRGWFVLHDGTLFEGMYEDEHCMTLTPFYQRKEIRLARKDGYALSYLYMYISPDVVEVDV